MEEIHVAHDGERVWSTSFIPNNTFFGPFQGNTVKLARRVLEVQESAKRLEDTDALANIYLESDEQVWLQFLPGARGKSEQNMEMIRGPDAEMYFRTTQDVVPRDELRAWFSPSLTRELGIIQDNNESEVNGNQLQCPQCLKTFDQQNLLSAHALLRCKGKADDTSGVNSREKQDKERSPFLSTAATSELIFSSAYGDELDSADEEISSVTSNSSHNELELRKDGKTEGHQILQRSELKQLTDDKYPLLSNPKFASLISSFSKPHSAKQFGAESLADYHKKEFRRKFQGNEHYLRKHLYREGPERRRIVTSSAPSRGLNSEPLLAASIAMERVIKKERFIDHCFHNDTESKRRNSGFSSDNDIRNRNVNCFHSDNFVHRERVDNVTEVENYVIEDDENPLNCVSVWRPFREQGIRAFSGSRALSATYGEHPGMRRCYSALERGCQTIGNYLRFRGQSSLSERTERAHIADLDRGIEAQEQKLDNSDKTKQTVLGKVLEDSQTASSHRADSKQEVEENNTNSEIPTLSTSEMKLPTVRIDPRALIQDGYVTNQRPWLMHHPSFVSGTHQSDSSITEMPPFYERSLPYTLPSFCSRFPCHPFVHTYMVPTGVQSPSRTAPQGFTCEFCGKVYCRKYVLKIHMRTHTGFKPLRCKFCDKSFSDPSNMKKHVKLHETENTVHKCKHCGRNFVRYRGLLNHIKSKHVKPMSLGFLY